MQTIGQRIAFCQRALPALNPVPSQDYDKQKKPKAMAISTGATLVTPAVPYQYPLVFSEPN